MKKSIYYASGKTKGEVQDRFKPLVKVLRRCGHLEKLHLKYWGGSNKHRYLDDSDYYKMIQICRFFEIDFKLGNDAPRGGATGDYIQIHVDTKNKFWETPIEDIFKGVL